MTKLRPALLLALAAFAPGCASGGSSSSGSAPRGGAVYGAYPPRNLQNRHPQTRAERSGFTETSTYADVVAFVDSLGRASKYVKVLSLGKSSSGKDIPLVILARPGVTTASDARRLNRPIVFIQGNIHGGEVEGKEALLSLLRDLATDQYANAADSLVIVAVPIYNIDGNDAFGPQERNRSEQNGPPSIGQRPNGMGLDLNRDYIKAEAPETRASLDLFRAWDPDVLVDLHTTDGSYHGYALTYSPSLNPAAVFAGPFTRDTVLPTLRAVLRQRHRIETFPYGNFDRDSIQGGWYTYDHRPRFGTNYYGLRGRVSILSEAYSHDPFRTRVASTYTFVSELLSLIAANHEDFTDLSRIADRGTTGFASTPNSSPAIAIRSRMTQTPRMEDMLVVDVERTGDSTRYEAGMPRGVRRTGKVRTARVPVYDRFQPALTTQLPFAWIVPAEQAALLEPLRRHGLFIEQIDARTVVRGERFLIDSVQRSARPFQGHQEVRLVGRQQPIDSLVIEQGAYVIRAAQPLGVLALYLLEAQSDDGLVTWNFVDRWLQPGGYYPIARALDRITAPLHPAGGP
jgi:hypothetical protein